MNLKIDSSLVINRLRVIATLLVVVGHATRMFSPQSLYHDSIPENILLTRITDLIYSFHMPLFFLISGFVYGICLDKGGVYDTFFRFIKKKGYRLILPYLFWGIAYVAPVMVCLSLTSMPYHKFVYGGILLGLDCRHLWFLLSLFEIFVGTQALVVLSKRIGLSTTISILIILAIAFGFRYLPDKSGILQFSSTCEYFIYFACGLAFFLAKRSQGSLWEYIIFAISCLLLFISLGVTGSVCLLISLLLALLIPLEAIPGFQQIKLNSMGIYILHPMMLYTIFNHYIISFSPFLFVSFAIVLVTLLSLFGSILLRKCKLAFLLGE